MNIDGLFSGSKWKIIEYISKKPSTLQNIATELGTSIANISQQIRFLEFADIIKRKRIQKNIAGKPESTFYLSNDFTYIIHASKDFCKKDFLNPDAFQSLMLYSWIGLEGKERESFESFVIENKKDVQKFYAVYGNTPQNGLPKKYVVFTDTPNFGKKTYGSLNFLFLKNSDNFDIALSKISELEGTNFFQVYMKKNKQGEL